jgi:vacuolar-type H+-ATPase subunit B/Vma2
MYQPVEVEEHMPAMLVAALSAIVRRAAMELRHSGAVTTRTVLLMGTMEITLSCMPGPFMVVQLASITTE